MSAMRLLRFYDSSCGHRIGYKKAPLLHQLADLISLHTPQAFGREPKNQFNQNLPELVLIKGNQQVTTKTDESLSPSLSTFRSHLAAVHHQFL
jgi:hypothetical protein